MNHHTVASPRGEVNDARRLDAIFTRADRICTASAQPHPIVWPVDIVAVAIGIASFALLLALIQGLDRV